MDWQSTDVRILIREAKDNVYPVEIESPRGQFRDISISLQAQSQISGLIEELEEMLDSGAQPKTEEPLVKLGQNLFRSLDADKLRQATDILPLDAGQPIRLQLRIRDRKIGTWPWELLHDVREATGRGRFDSPFLALCNRVMFSRYREKPVAVPQPEKLDKLRILVIVSSDDLDQMARTDIESLKVIGNTNERLELCVLERANLENLWAHMKQVQHPYHVIHFIGHGYMHQAITSGEAPKTGIKLEQADGSSKEVEAGVFAKWLQKSQRQICQRVGVNDELVSESYPRLVTLNACHSASTIFSVANAMVDCDLPAVIGMRFKAPTVLANLFTEGLYKHLLDGYPVDLAVAESRRRLKNEFSKDFHWCIPVLYLRAKDGILFDFNPESKEAVNWLEQLQHFSELAGSQAVEATRALLKTGASATMMSIAVVLAYPLAAVRAGAAALLRRLPRTPEVHDSVINLVATALEHEQDVTVRREVTSLLAQPRVSRNAELHLNSLVSDHDPQVRDIARAGQNIQRIPEQNLTEAEVFSLLSDVFFPTLKSDFNQLFDQVSNQLEQVTATLNQLSTIVGNVLRPGKSYNTYLQQVSDAHSRAAKLRQLLVQAKSKATGMTADEVWSDLRPKIANWVEDANQVISAADRAAHATDSLSDRLALALSEVVETLGHELTLMRELEEMTQELDGFTVSDVQGNASISIARSDTDTGGSEN